MLTPKKILSAAALMLVASMLAASDAEAQTCTTFSNVYDEGFDSTTYDNIVSNPLFVSAPTTSASGWGAGVVQLSLKGNTFDSSSQNIGEKVFVVGSGDFDNDGWIDMAAIMLSPNRLHFLKNMGVNADGSHKGFSTGGSPNSPGWTAQIIDNNIPDFDTNSPSVVAGDFDGDGDPDVLYMKTGTQDNAGSVIRAFIYRLDGVVSGIPKFTRIELTSFFQTYRVSWHWTANFSQVVDWDKDGRADLVAGSSWGSTNRIMLFKAAPTGIGFQAPVILVTDAGFTAPFADTGATASGGSTCTPPAKSGFNGRGISSLTVDDFDSDGDKDIIVGSLSEKNLHFFTNDGADVMTRVADITFSYGGPTFLLNGDLDGDGDTDLTVGRDGYNCGGSGGNVYFYANDGHGNFTPRTLPILSAGADLDFGAAFYIDENIKNPSLNKHPDYTIDVIAADGNDSGTYNEILAQRSTVYNLSGSAISTIIDNLDNTQNAIVAVTMTGLKQTVPPSTGISFSVTNDGGANWETLQPGEIYNGARPLTHTFTHFGSDFRFRADLTTTAVTLVGAEATLAPGSKTTPLLDDVAWEYQYVQKREYSRSALAFASQLPLADGTLHDIIFSSTFFYPGFEGTLKAFKKDVALGTSTEANNDLNQVVVKTGTGNALAWDAGALLKSVTGGSRTIYTALPNSSGVVNQRQPFSSGNASTLFNAMATDQTTAGKVIDFVRNGFGQVGGTKLFDVGHSSPVFVAGTPNTSTAAADPSLAADNYTGFATQMANAKRDSMVYIGANSGMVHAFLATTGEEKWAFVPYNLLAKLKNQMQTDSSGNVFYNHQSMVDGSIVVRDVFDRTAGKWKTILVGGEALGTGRADENYYFALDVTDPTNPQPIWEFTDPWNADNTSCTGLTSQTVCTAVPLQTCTTSCQATNHAFAAAGGVGNIIMEAEDFNSAASIDATHNWTESSVPTTPTAFAGTGYMQGTPATGTTNCTNFATCGATLDYSFQVATPGAYKVYIRYQSATAAKLRYRVGSVDETLSLTATTDWTWAAGLLAGTFSIGEQDLQVFMINDGVLLDKIVIVGPGGTVPTGDGGLEQCANTCVVTGTTQSCTVKTYAPDQESFECGVGSNLKCCAASATQFYCSPVGQACGTLDTVTGETWSPPVVAPVKYANNRTWFIFFGSGYNNRTGLPAAVGRSVYGIDAVTGLLKARWDYDDLPQTSLNVSTIDNTIPGGVQVFDYTTTGTDPTPDGFADVAYVGDLEGRLWKIDLHQSASAGSGGIVSLTTWPTCELFDAADQNNNGSRAWAPIITTPAVTTIKQDTSPTAYLPYVYFGTGGDDRAPSSLLYRFYAVKDTVNCPTSSTPTLTTAKHEADLKSDTSHLQWIVGDHVGPDFKTPLNPPNAEGMNGQRYWSDPVIFQNAVIYFASLGGSIESVNPCDNLADSSLLYGYAIHDFFSGASSPAKAGSSIVTLSGFAGTAPYYRSASKIRRSAMVAMQMPTAGVSQPPPANASSQTNQPSQVFIQTFDGNVRSITPPTVNDVNTIRVLRWRELPLF